MESDAWIYADDKTKCTAQKVFELLQKESLSIEQFHVMLKILPDIIYENTIIKSNA